MEDRWWVGGTELSFYRGQKIHIVFQKHFLYNHPIMTPYTFQCTAQMCVIAMTLLFKHIKPVIHRFLPHFYCSLYYIIFYKSIYHTEHILI